MDRTKMFLDRSHDWQPRWDVKIRVEGVTAREIAILPVALDLFYPLRSSGVKHQGSVLLLRFQHQVDADFSVITSVVTNEIWANCVGYRNITMTGRFTIEDDEAFESYKTNLWDYLDWRIHAKGKTSET